MVYYYKEAAERSSTLVHQGHLLAALRNIFPNEKILSNSRKKGEVKNSATGKYIELDLWIPTLKLGFEFQDVYHYVSMWYVNTSLTEIQERDDFKKHSVKLKKYTLVIVPCWWDANEASLFSSISFQRPDLAWVRDIESHSPISLNPPEDFFEVQHGSSGIPDVGELMLASFPTEPRFHTKITQSNAWWMGEKYDGVRCCWNPLQRALYTRVGNELNLLEPMVDMLPNEFIDSEIWFGRGLFPDSQRVVKMATEQVSWHGFRMVTFDIASLDLQYSYFEDRFRVLHSFVEPNHPFLIVVSRALCFSKQHLVFALQLQIENGGEGVILRRPRSFYDRGRSPFLYKLKASRGDREAVVVDVTSNKSVILKLPNNVTFEVPPHNNKTNVKLKKGDVVTFTYDDYSRKETPFNARIFRVREDVSWEEVVQRYLRDTPHAQALTLNEKSHAASDYKEKQHSYWTASKNKNARLFFENFARRRNLDPLLPETWYNVSWKTVRDLKGAGAIQYHAGSIPAALVKLFPNIGLDITKFTSTPKRLWQDLGKRRQFFFRLAKKKGFDALVAKNWYSITSREIVANKGARVLLGYYDGSAIKALIHLFPDIGLEDSKFYFGAAVYWQFAKNRRGFYERYARKKGFDPLVASNWYSIARSMVYNKFENTDLILKFHNGSFIRSLLDLFPDVAWDETKFAHSAKNYYKDRSKRKLYFEKFAKRNGFDPLVAENWYPIHSTTVATQKGKVILGYHSGSLAAALIDVFPDIGLDASNFHFLPKSHWESADNWRKYFDQFASFHNFDPLIASNWYSLPAQIIAERKSQDVLRKYDVGRTLCEAYPEIGLDESSFLYPASHWHNPNNRKRFFKLYARHNNFDPLVADNWYSISNRSISSQRNAEAVMRYYDGSVIKALVELFPTLALEQQKFKIYIENYWADKSNRRAFFENLARDQGFDPLTSHLWYSVSPTTILARQGADSVMKYYSKNVYDALTDLFPELTLDSTQFEMMPTSYWHVRSNRRQFFEKFAKKNKFDPLLPENWYTIRRRNIIDNEGSNILDYYGGSVVRAILDLFPSIGLDENRFIRVRKKHWHDVDNKKKLLLEFAEKSGFDPYVLDNWGEFPIDRILSVKGANSILEGYSGNIKHAVKDIFMTEVT